MPRPRLPFFSTIFSRLRPADRPRTAPLDLPRLVMRRAMVVGLAVLTLAMGAGLLRAQQVIDNEVDAAMTLAMVMARLGTLDRTGDEQALHSLRLLQADDELRHLTLSVYTAGGDLLLAPEPHRPAAPQLAWLFDLHRRWWPHADTRSVSWPVRRPDGPPWTVTLHASPEGEREEAMVDLAGLFAILLGGSVGLLLIMRWNVRRAFAPLATLLDAIGRIERQEPDSVQRLAAMPIRELEVIAVALRHLAQALAQAEDERRMLSQKVLTLQEDERTRLARELHDEFGQRLTALRLDAAWLLRQTAAQPELAAVARSMSERCGEIQQDIRHLLEQLRPLGPWSPDVAQDRLPLSRLLELLDALVQGWQAARPAQPDRPTRYELQVRLIEPGRKSPRALRGTDQTAAADTDAAPLLSQALVLAVYRLSQEALTNAARHAGARQVVLSLEVAPDADGPGQGTLLWSVRDDGVGLDQPTVALQRGNGLGGMQERVWALGGQWSIGKGPGGAGLVLSARLPLAPVSDLSPALPLQAGPAGSA